MKTCFKIVFSISIFLISPIYVSAQPRIIVDPLELEPWPWFYENAEWSVFISNSGNEALEYTIQIEYHQGRDWIEVVPLNGIIEPNQESELSILFDDWWREDGDYRADIHILNNDPQNSDVVVRVYIDIPFSYFFIHLDEGWSLISSPYRPNQDQIPDVFYGLVEEQSPPLLMVKDGQGRFYIPAYNFNSIPCWNFREGYQVKMARADDLILSGLSIPFDTPLPLHQGWNLIAYFPAAEIAAPEAFRNIREVLLLAKDGAGNFYNPERDFNNMPPLRRGQGYQVKVSRDVDFVWFVP